MKNSKQFSALTGAQVAKGRASPEPYSPAFKADPVPVMLYQRFIILQVHPHLRNKGRRLGKKTKNKQKKTSHKIKQRVSCPLATH